MRPPAWLQDPLNDTLVRYWDGQRWTFHTVVKIVEAAPSPTVEASPQPAAPALRPDIAHALNRVRGLVIGSKKEINLLAGYLHPDEQVLALTGAQGEGQGVLACTNQRLLFLFVGVLRKQFVEVSWNRTKHITYDRATKLFSVYTGKPTRRAIPAMAVRVANLADAQAVAAAAQEAASAPRLDVV